MVEFFPGTVNTGVGFEEVVFFRGVGVGLTVLLKYTVLAENVVLGAMGRDVVLIVALV